MSNPTDAAEVERAPRRAPSAAPPSSPARRGAGEDGEEVTGGPVLGGAEPSVTAGLAHPRKLPWLRKWTDG